MTQDKIYNAETGAFVGNRKVYAYNDRGLGHLYVIPKGRPFDCMLNDETNRFEV